MVETASEGRPPGPPDDVIIGTIAEFLTNARDALSRGDRQTAESILDGILAQRSDNAAAWHLRGLCARDAGQSREAMACFTRAVAHNKDDARFCAALASSLEEIGRNADAQPAWYRAVDLAPHRADYRRRLAALQARLGRVDVAVAQYAAAIDADPFDISIAVELGVMLMRANQLALARDVLRAAHATAPQDGNVMYRLGQANQRLDALDDAVSWYRRALDHSADTPDLRADLAAALLALGDPGSALEHAQAALVQRPDFPRALNNLGLALCALGQPKEALLRLSRAQQLDPDNCATWHNLGTVLHKAGQTKEAEGCLRNLLARAPGFADAHRSLGNLLRESGRFEEAATHYQAVVDSEPMDVKTYGNLGLLFLNLNRAEEALAVYEKARALAPDNADIRMSLGITQLLLGDFTNGWANYEARWRAEKSTTEQRAFAADPWRGQSLAPQRDGDDRPSILIHAEQGFGDTLQFCRYVPMVMAQGGRVIFECQAPLAGLMESLAAPQSRGELIVVTRADAKPPFDFHAPLLDLPKVFGTELSSIPADVPYLRPPAGKAAQWAARLAGKTPSVGLVWSGNPARQDDWMRSCPPDALVPLLQIAGMRFFSLQKDGPAFPDKRLEDLAPALDDFGDTAAAIEALDLVITVDTAVAHLAGALDRPVWVLLGHAADWRYLTDRDDNPWYPSMRVWRQKHHGDWSDPINRIAEILPAALGCAAPGQ
ncbi:MAG: tetratricopeptide repeat protein [Alphaproteobacteria bacterium]|nr:tetratricopeptide repeat protein [Alphaproteobacteria bacterium]